ncbi:hypothetical protein ACFLT2_03790 [Acidobacteriota bacterium]
MKKNSAIPASLAVAFVWFTTHFGGGFASGRQVVEFFTQYGWYALFMPIFTVAIMAGVYYFSWKFAAEKKLFDYRSWANAYFQPVQFILANVYEVLFNLILITATAVAFATGGAVIEEAFGTPYILNTIVIAFAIFFLTIYGADMVRKAAAWSALVIIVGLLAVYGSHFIARFPQLLEILNSAPNPKGFGPALWNAVVYAGFQATLIGAFVAVADVLKDRRDALKATLWGFAVNGCFLWLASVVLLSFYPAILPERVPVLYVINKGFGFKWMEFAVSLLILFAVISTGVNLIFGGAKRIVTVWAKNENPSRTRAVNVVASGVYVVITWAIALFGLIPLIAKGYGYIGYIAIFALIIPVLLFGLLKKSANP